MKQPFFWDNYSDQPAQLKDKVYKKKMRKAESKSLLKTLITALVIIPISLIMMPFVKRKQLNTNEFFCLGVDFEREPIKTIEMIKDLKVERILLRFKLWEIEKLNALSAFINLNQDKKITLKILQDRENIEDLELLENNLLKIFTKLESSVDIFEIGSTINRAKWGFFSVDEYNKFYEVAYRLKIEKFKNLTLIGSGVIDFEYHFTAHTLFNFFKYRYDGVSSLLYVDRRGAPENSQMGFALSDKIALLTTMIWLSPKSEHTLHITETNWPISNTAPYAPTSEYECVSEESYANFMLRYHLLVFASQQVNTLSWHQLIASGYGLVDNRKELSKRQAYSTYKFMLENLKNAQFLRLDVKRDYYILQCLKENRLLQIHWATEATTLKNEDFFTVYNKNGELVNDKILHINDSPLYIYIKDAV